MKKIESFKDKIENQTIKRLNIIETENNEICIVDLELMNGDKIEFQNNKGNVYIILRSARDLEIEKITEELNKMEIGSRRTFSLSIIYPDDLRKLALVRATELGHQNPLNTVKGPGPTWEVDFTDNNY